jgi:carbamoyl-phosphate synthase large subunit
MSFVDQPRVVPPIHEPDYVDVLFDLARREKIGLLIPLIDLDLLPLARAKERFAAAGCTVVVTSAETVAICRDKQQSFRHLRAAGIDTPTTWTYEELLREKRRTLPYFVKPRSGSAGAGLHLVETEYDFQQIPRWVDDPIIQEYVRGDEYTLDVYAGFDGRPACVVPRRRLRVRGGEVSQSQVALDADLIAVGRRVVQSLRGCMGVVTIQCIRRANNGITVIEINPRFGGGVPLSIAAGADMPAWLLAEHLGRMVRIPPTARIDGLLMTRYDQSVFLKPMSRR